MIRKAIATIVGCVLSGAVLGGSLGSLLGKCAPGYYRAVFVGAIEPGFDPVSVGFGLGLTQGAFCGVAVGLAVVALSSWREVRLCQRTDSADSAGDPQHGFVPRARTLFWISAALLGLGSCFCIGLFLGDLRGEGGANYRRYVEERTVVHAEIAGDPAFAGVRIERLSSGGAYLSGEIATQADLQRLRAAIARVLGEPRAEKMTYAVDVRQ